LEFKKVVLGAFAYLVHYKEIFAKKLLIPAGGFLTLDFLSQLSFTASSSLLISLLTLVLYVLLAIVAHRIVLLGPDSVADWGISGWSSRETSFFLHALGLGMIMLIPLVSVLLSFIPFIILIALPFSFWLLSRLSLVLPGIAVDQGFTFQQSWEATRHFQLQMFGVVFLIPFLLGGIGLVIAQLPFSAFLVSLYSIVASVYEIVLLSLAFQAINKERPDASGGGYPGN